MFYNGITNEGKEHDRWTLLSSIKSEIYLIMWYIPYLYFKLDLCYILKKETISKHQLKKFTQRVADSLYVFMTSQLKIVKYCPITLLLLSHFGPFILFTIDTDTKKVYSALTNVILFATFFSQFKFKTSTVTIPTYYSLFILLQNV